MPWLFGGARCGRIISHLLPIYSWQGGTTRRQVIPIRRLVLPGLRAGSHNEYSSRERVDEAMLRTIRWVLPGILVAILLVGVVSCSRGANDGVQGGPRDEVLVGTVISVVEERETELMGHAQIQQKLALMINAGPRRGDVVVVDHEIIADTQAPYRTGERLYFTRSEDAQGRASYYVVGYDRGSRLFLMFLLFVALVVVIGRKGGARSLLGMALSFGVILFFILPRISQGDDPVLVAVLGAALVMPISYYLAHGLNRKTTVALAGSLVGLVLTGLLAMAFVGAVRLTGTASEEVGFLQAMHPVNIDVRGLLLAGMVISVLGVLDDITVAQSAIVEQLQAANPALDWRELYTRAMRVGQDHIASMVNTLVLVYAGAALPLLILLSDRSLPFWYVLSHETVAEEVVRVLVTSTGLVSAVPITTIMAAVAIGWRRRTGADAEPAVARAGEPD
jgi:uncharacterized membrane protein